MHLFVKEKLEANNTLSGKIKNRVIELMHLQLPYIDNHDSLYCSSLYYVVPKFDLSIVSNIILSYFCNAN